MISILISNPISISNPILISISILILILVLGIYLILSNWGDLKPDPPIKKNKSGGGNQTTFIYLNTNQENKAYLQSLLNPLLEKKKK